MNEETSKNDIDRVGLSETSRLILEELVADGHFKDAISGYRMAISFSIFKEIEFKEHAVNRPAGHMYLISQLDPEGIFGLLIEEMYPEFQKERYRTLEKLADMGLPRLKDYIGDEGSLIFWEK